MTRKYKQCLYGVLVQQGPSLMTCCKHSAVGADGQYETVTNFHDISSRNDDNTRPGVAYWIQSSTRCSSCAHYVNRDAITESRNRGHGKRKAEHNPLSANVEDQHSCSHGKTGSPKDPLLAIKGVGQKTADKLRKAGYSSVKQLRKATPTELSQSTGIASVTASNIIRAAKTRRPALLRMLANLMRDPFPRVQRCRDCTWWSRAGLDGHINKGICNYGTDQTKPFTMTVGQRVNIAWARQRGCDHFKRISLDIRH